MASPRLAAATLALASGLAAFPGSSPAAGPARARAGADGGELLVFAAASLADALGEIGTAFAAESRQRVAFNFGGSNELARQVRAGAPADVFFSADEAQMDALARVGLVSAAGRADLLSNTLVVIVPADSRARLSRPEDLRLLASLALADPGAVPAGVYARAWLERRGLWEALAPLVVPALDVRAALAAVESGNVDAGIVYRTDAARSRRVRVAYEVTGDQAPAIRYPVAPLASSTHPAAAAAFVDYLRAKRARAVFERHGFIVLGER